VAKSAGWSDTPAMKTPTLLMVAAALMSAACGNTDAASPVRIGDAFVATPVAQFSHPWAMTFLPDGRLLVTEKSGALKLLNMETGNTGDITGVPPVKDGGQGGFGDVILHPAYAQNSWVYLSYAEPGDAPLSGAAVARARLVLNGDDGKLEDLQVIWRQAPKINGLGHYGHRMAFGPDGKLWVTSSERQ